MAYPSRRRGIDVRGRLLLIALVVAAVTAPMLPAQATFPGQNGRIAFRAS